MKCTSQFVKWHGVVPGALDEYLQMDATTTHERLVFFCSEIFKSFLIVDDLDRESRKSPTAELFDIDSGRISIRHCEVLKSITLNVLARSQG
ncbi:hypothetical protein Tco_0793288 [Tanacetum coccineum]